MYTRRPSQPQYFEPHTNTCEYLFVNGHKDTAKDMISNTLVPLVFHGDPSQRREKEQSSNGRRP